MTVPAQARYRLSLSLFLAVAAVVLLADQASKYWAVTALTDSGQKVPAASETASTVSPFGVFLWRKHPRPQRPVVVHPDFFHFRYIENPGAAWGFLAGSASRLRTPFFLALSLVAVVGLLWARSQLSESRFFTWGLPLIFGGALGNFFDRVRLGYVIDFIDWHWFERAAWPTFNVADAAITCGVLLILPSQLRPHSAPQSCQADDSSLAREKGA